MMNTFKRQIGIGQLISSLIKLLYFLQFDSLINASNERIIQFYAFAFYAAF